MIKIISILIIVLLVLVLPVHGGVRPDLVPLLVPTICLEMEEGSAEVAGHDLSIFLRIDPLPGSLHVVSLQLRMILVYQVVRVTSVSSILSETNNLHSEI